MCFRLMFEQWPAVVVEETRIGVEEALHPEEAAQVAHAVPARRLEFATGRSCARRALARLHGSRQQTETFALLNGPDRAPRWPAGVVGSITHTGRAPNGYCAVAVGRRQDLRTVGMDAERAAPLDPALWPYTLTSRERLWLGGVEPARAGLLATVMFSAKESFYKAQYPLSSRFLGFGDVEITLDQGAGVFEARLTEGSRKDFPLSHCVGRYIEDAEFVFTGVALEAADTQFDRR